MKNKRTFRLLKDKNYVLYWFATALSMGASNILQYLLALHVLNLTGSSTIYASVLSIVVIPRIILTPIAGVIGDRFKKIKLMTFLNIITSIFMLIFSLLALHENTLNIIPVFVLVIGLEIIEIFYQAPEAAVLSEIVKEDMIEEAAVLSKIDDGIVFIISPLIAVTSYKLFGIVGSLFLVFIILSLTTSLNFFIKTPFSKINSKSDSNNPFRQFLLDFKEGLIEIKNDKFLKRLVIVLPIIDFNFSAVFQVVITYMLLEMYNINEYSFGIYKSVTASMTIIVPFLIMPFVKKLKPDKVLKPALVIISVSIFLIAVASKFGLNANVSTKNIVLAIITFFDCLTIASIMPMHLAFSVYMHKNVKSECKSRVMSVIRMLSIASVPLGSMFYGIILEFIPVYISIAIAAITIMVTVPLCNGMKIE